MRIPLLLVLLLCACTANANPPTIVATLGKREVILASGQHGLKYFPDECLTFIQTTPPMRVLMATGVSTMLLEGEDMKSLIPRGKVLQPGPPGSFDNGYAGINGVARDPTTGNLMGFYHAEDHEGMRPIPGGIPGFYCSVGLAMSADNGASFSKLGPVLTSPVSKDVNGRADQGCGESCVVADGDQQYLLMYYVDHSHVNNRGVQICLARCPMKDIAKTDGWRKFYDGQFSEPGLGGKETPVMSAQAFRATATFPQVTWAPPWRCYIMVFSIVVYSEWSSQKEPQQSGMYIASSPDGIHWTKPTQLMAIRPLAAIGREVGWHPTLFLSSITDNSAQGWLYYSYSESWGHKPPLTPHYLVGQPIRLSLSTAAD